MKRYPVKRTRAEVMCWLFITAINEHIMKCRSAQFPDEHPECRDKCCPNESCCTTCNTLRWLRDNDDAYLTKVLSRYDTTLSDWQMADGSVDWPQIERHWDDSGMACNREVCLQADAKRLGMGPWSEEALAGWTVP